MYCVFVSDLRDARAATDGDRNREATLSSGHGVSATTSAYSVDSAKIEIKQSALGSKQTQMRKASRPTVLARTLHIAAVIVQFNVQGMSSREMEALPAFNDLSQGTVHR